MISIEVVDFTALIAFWLCFTRWIAIMIQLPIFDNVSIPMVVKILATLLITYAFFPYLSGEIIKDINYVGVDQFWILTIFNTVVGLLIGFLVKSIMQMFIGSGSIVTRQIGFAMLMNFDPNAATRIGPFEKLIHWTVLILILTSGALIPMFRGALGSFFSIHIYDIGKIAQSPQYFVELFKGIFLSSLLLASPLIFGNVFIMVVLGIIARMVPQMNVIMVSFVVNIGLGLVIFLACSDEFFRVAFKLYTEKLGEWFQFVS
ncbi:MAG: flagellar biosynthetic protein FliR [Bacteriovoracaceae bacterium]|nr:flagellar biosynthetic protein FliR [Bacteriovoracaceae bacterium]